MIISSSNIQLSSQHSAIEKHSVSESLKMWVGKQRPDFEGQESAQKAAPPADIVRFSDEGKSAALAYPSIKTAAIDHEKELKSNPRYMLIKLMVEALTGIKIKLVEIEDFQPSTTAADIPDPHKAAAPEQAKLAGFGVEYERHETHYVSEQTAFSATGTVTTADGKSIKFDLNFAMSHEHIEQSDVSLRLGDAKKKDPLVINFSGTAAQLGITKFSFDLDADGKAEQISFVGSGSGFLALDKNGDGKINNGSELFGPASGNGFQDLAAYDQDKNGWIDESDAVYSQFKIWTGGGSDNSTLSTLAQTKVGAIYLGNISTPFDLKNSQNQLDGQVKTSGIYLKEDGSAGTVQQIDLVV